MKFRTLPIVAVLFIAVDEPYIIQLQATEGILYILRNGETYTATGAEVK